MHAAEANIGRHRELVPAAEREGREHRSRERRIPDQARDQGQRGLRADVLHQRRVVAQLTSPGADKMLESLSHIVIDELHERDLFADFLTIVLRGVLDQHRHLRLVLMSATVREDLFSDYFGGCPVIRVPIHHPVADYHLEDILSLVGYGGGGGGGGVHDFVHAATADPDLPEGQAVQAAVMRAFRGNRRIRALDTVRGVGAAGGFDERALVGVAHAQTGATALMAAAGKGRHVEVSQLIGMGADPTQRSRDGSSSADWARRFGHEDIAQTLDAAEDEIRRLSAMENAAQMSQYQIQADPDEVDLQPRAGAHTLDPHAQGW